MGRWLAFLDLKSHLFLGLLCLHVHVQDTQKDNKGLPAILLSLISTSVCIDVFTRCMPPKTSWDGAQRSIIRQSRVCKQWRKDREIDTSSRVQRHFPPFKKDARKWRENREKLVSNLENRWSVNVEGWALRMLLWAPGVAMGCMSFVICAYAFRRKSSRNTLKSISFQKNNLEEKSN